MIDKAQKFMRGDRFLLHSGEIVWFVNACYGEGEDGKNKMESIFKVTSAERGLFQIQRTDIKEVVTGMHSKKETNAGVQEAGTDRDGEG